MTGKLIKYEIRSSIRLIGLIWIALLAVSVLLGIVMGIFDRLMQAHGAIAVLGKLLSVIPPLLYAGIFIAMFVIMVLLVLLRFYKGLLGDEGYLMHTLPVKPWQLITAKGVVAAGVVIVSSIVAVLSIMILVGFDDFSGMMRGIGNMLESLADEPKYILVVIEGVILMVLSALQSVYRIYAAMAIGQLADKYRALASLAAYIAINIALTVLFVAIILIGDATGLDYVLGRWLMGVDFTEKTFTIIQMTMGAMFLVTVVQLAAFHVITERILSLKLNLL